MKRKIKCKRTDKPTIWRVLEINKSHGKVNHKLADWHSNVWGALERNQQNLQPSVCHQFSSVSQSCVILYNPTDCSMRGFPVHHQLPEFSDTRLHWVHDAIQPSYPLTSSSPSAFKFSQHQRHFQWASFSHQVAKVLEFLLPYPSFQWIFRTDFL